MKTLQNQRFSDVFIGYRKRPETWNELRDITKHDVRSMCWKCFPTYFWYSHGWVSFDYRILVFIWLWDRQQVLLQILSEFKGYLRYKTITYQIVPYETQVKDFLFHRNVMFNSWDIQVFVFSTIPWFTKSDIMMSISTWGRVHF